MGSHVCRNCLTEFRKVLAHNTFPLSSDVELGRENVKVQGIISEGIRLVSLCVEIFEDSDKLSEG